MNVEEYIICGCKVTVRRPILTEQHQAEREKEILIALEQFGRSAKK